MKILGVSAFYHDSAASLIIDGKIIAAAQEERFTRKKHDESFPTNSIEYCLKSAKLTAKDIDFVTFYDKPFLKFERLLSTYLASAPKGYRSFIKSMPVWIKDKIWIKEKIRSELSYKGKILFTEHHEAHAASAFYPSPFQEAAFLTLDGVGEWATTSFGVGKGNNIKILKEIHFPHSLGLLYSSFTYYLGFRVNSGEYKLMGLAAYGEPKYKKLILSKLVDLKKDGSFRLNMDYFNFASGLTMTNSGFHKLFGANPKKPESTYTQKDMDIASSIQSVTEDIMLLTAQHIYKETGKKYLCLAGGVALNCVANGILLKKGPFEDVWIQPAAGDAGGALGAALLTWYQYLGNKRKAEKNDSMQGAYLGPEFDDAYIKKFLVKNKISYEKLGVNNIPIVVASHIADQKVIGWFQGRMEFGPRALGNRSILGDARSSEMQKQMNLKIKYRESFRPFAPSVLREKISEFFDLDHDSPYMLLVASVVSSKKRKMSKTEEKLFGIDKLNIVRSVIPAVTHVDYSARVQTVHKSTNPLYHKLLRQFDKKYSMPVIINTSFNVRGEPIVCTPKDAYLCFMRTEMDYLMLGSYIIDKRKQKPLKNDSDWRKEFVLD